ncbi:hypothetical protein P7C70_g9361, partial [Phenoliferia sp. Uapishka_3]
MFDPDREDLEWDDSLRANSDDLDHEQDTERAIRPLPKRQRIQSHQPPPSTTLPAPPPPSGRPSTEAGKNEKTLQEVVEADNFAPVVTHEPALEYRPTTGRFSDDDDDGRAANHIPPPKSSAPLTVEIDPADAPLSTTSSAAATATASPGTSPSSVLSFNSLSRINKNDILRGPEYFPIFGEAGEELLRSLATASPFSSAGLFGGLGLASLHPSLSSPSELVTGGEEEEDYSLVRERSYAERSAGVSIGLGGVVSGNNKKKRKIPGVNQSLGAGGEDDDRGFDGEEGGEEGQGQTTESWKAQG